MISQKSGATIFMTGSPARPHVPGATTIGAAFGAIENLTGNLAFEAIGQVALSNFLKVPATVKDTANAAVLIASDRARMMTGTVVNASTGALD